MRTPTIARPVCFVLSGSIVAALAVTVLASPASADPPCPTPNTWPSLSPGQGLASGQVLAQPPVEGQDPSATVRLVMQTDGNLVAYTDAAADGSRTVTFATGTAGHPGAYFVYQQDGNLVVYSAAGTPLWANNGDAHGPLILECSGTAFQHARYADELSWSSVQGFIWIEPSLTSGRYLVPSSSAGDSYLSTISTYNGNFFWKLQADGNFVEYNSASGGSRALWSSGTYRSGANLLLMQSDGNAVLYRRNGATLVPLWSTGTGGNPGAALLLQGDGNMVVYSATRQVLWTNSGNTR